MICCRHLSKVLMAVLLIGAASSIVNASGSTAEELEQLYLQLKPKFADAVEVTIDQLERDQKGELIWVDVRAAREQAVSIIPGAITAKQFEQSPDRYRNAYLVAYCTIGYRSGKFAIKWHKRGYNISNLKGGVLAWAHAGKLFQAPSGERTRRVHTYGRTWNFLPEGYTAEW